MSRVCRRDIRRQTGSAIEYDEQGLSRDIRRQIDSATECDEQGLS